MTKRDKNRIPMPWSGRNSQGEPDPQKQAEAKKLMTMLLANSIIILTVYFLLNNLEFWPIFFIYMGVAAVLVVAYAIYNRGFVYKDATIEMLPQTLSVEERTAILEEAKARLRKSRWMLTLILPFLVAFMLDALYLFVLSDLFAMIGIV